MFSIEELNVFDHSVYLLLLPTAGEEKEEEEEEEEAEEEVVMKKEQVAEEVDFAALSVPSAAVATVAADADLEDEEARIYS